MKIFALILTFIVIGLTFVPCIDHNVVDVHKTEISTAANNNHQTDADHCSPFCTCQCCQTNFDISISSVASINIGTDYNYYEYSSNFQSIELFDFLIPPKS